MFRRLRILDATLAGACALGISGTGLVPVAPAAARAIAGSDARPTAPSASQIQQAVARATHSRYLWGTVNVCVPHGRRGGVVGVRGEMTALGFPAALAMTIQLDSYDARTGQLQPVDAATARSTVNLGTLSHGIHQGGAEFPYSTAAGTLAATITFSWTRDGQRLATVPRPTTGGHPSAAFGQPAHHSSASCRL